MKRREVWASKAKMKKGGLYSKKRLSWRNHQSKLPPSHILLNLSLIRSLSSSQTTRSRTARILLSPILVLLSPVLVLLLLLLFTLT